MPTLTLPGCHLYYEVHGEGPAIVLAHGRGGCAASWWQQVPDLAADHRVVTFDHRGFARSTVDRDGPHAGRFADDLAALVDHLGLDRPVLIGQSMGGASVLGLALRRRSSIRGLVLSCTAGKLRLPAVERSQAARAAIPRGAGAPTAALAAGFRDAEPARTFLYEQIRAMTPPFGPRFRESLDDLAEGGVDPAALAGFAVPTLVLAGEDDPLYPADVLEAVRAAIPGARLQRIEGVGHSPYWEAPERFDRIIRDFVASLPP